MSNNKVFKQIFLPVIYSALWGTVFAVYCGYQENNKTEWWQSLIISIAPAIITGIITSKASKKSQLRENNEAINKLSEKIGNNNFERSLQSQIGVKDNDCSLAERIGNVKDSGSLTYQHLMILEAVNSYKKEKGYQMKKLSKRQKDIKKMIEYISEVFKDWEILAHRDSELKEEIENLKKENRELKQEIICQKQEKTVVIEKDEIDKEIVL